MTGKREWRPAHSCFIDTLRPVTPAEREDWACYLTIPAPCMKAARAAFRRVHGGDRASGAFLAFAGETGLNDQTLLRRLEDALHGLAGERAEAG